MRPVAFRRSSKHCGPGDGSCSGLRSGKDPDLRRSSLDYQGDDVVFPRPEQISRTSAAAVLFR